MACCAPSAEPGRQDAGAPAAGADEMTLASRDRGGGLRQTDLAVPGMHCGGCIQRIERALSALAGVQHARANLSTRSVAVLWRAEGGPPPLIETLKGMGYDAHLHDREGEEKDRGRSELVRALAVAGFASANIMLLSVSVWSGAEPATRDLFHWISALIALPTIAYSGRIFFRSAWRALRHGQTNMDVPISIGVLLAAAMSLHDTIQGGQHAYFDASVMLLFFLLIGRTLDHMMRDRARVAVKGLARLAPRGALVMQEDGTRDYLPVAQLRPGMTILLAAGERVPVDALVATGRSDLDCSLVTGESMPQPVSAGSRLQAGTLNLTGPLTIRATATAEGSFLAEVRRLMEAAEAGRAGYRRIADRAARLYAPVVHSAALLSFAGWMAATGDAHRAITIAVAVLIITCPCALGLAVPMVQVVAARRLFEQGIVAKDGSALERLAEIDAVVFDKTGTLTRGEPRLRADAADPAHLATAAALAAHSRHPLSRALAARAPRNGTAIAFERISELPGCGLEAKAGPDVYRLGRPEWAVRETGSSEEQSGFSTAVLSKNGIRLADFRFDDDLRSDAAEAVAELAGRGLAVEILSGDRPGAVRRLAGALGVARFQAGVLPGDKAAHLAALAGAGRKVLMVGDGLNDAPALTAAHVSMAPASGADIGRNAADFVFLRDSLRSVPRAIALARRAAGLIRQNFALAIVYNAIALPLAVAGFVTPLVAALAMSGSSLLVVANALRLSGGTRDGQGAADAAPAPSPVPAAAAE